MKLRKKINYSKHDKVAKSLGLTGKNGHYVTPLGLEIDTTASKADQLCFGYLIAKKAGHI